MIKILWFLISLFLLYQNCWSFSTTQYLEAFIPKELFLNDTNREIYKALINQSLPPESLNLHNSSINEKLYINSVNFTIIDFSIDNTSTFDIQSIHLKNASIKLSFSLDYFLQTTYSSPGQLNLQDCDIKIQYNNIDGLYKIRISVIGINRVDVIFENSTSITDSITKLFKANMLTVTTKCSDLLSTQINQYFDLNYNETFGTVLINNLSLYYILNVTNVNYSDTGLIFKANYSIYDENSFFVHSQVLANYINFTNLTNLTNSTTKIPSIIAKNMKLPLQFFQDMIIKAHNDHFFNYLFNENNVKIQGFSFYIGDLAFVMPSITDDYLPDTQVNVFCGSNDNSPPSLQFTDPLQIEVAYRINCSIKIRNTTIEILSFDSFLHPFINLTVVDNNLNFIMNSIRPEGDNSYHETKYAISGKKGKDILNYWISETYGYFQQKKLIFGVLNLPINGNNGFKLKIQDNNLLICGLVDENTDCFQ